MATFKFSNNDYTWAGLGVTPELQGAAELTKTVQEKALEILQAQAATMDEADTAIRVYVGGSTPPASAADGDYWWGPNSYLERESSLGETQRINRFTSQVPLEAMEDFHVQGGSKALAYAPDDSAPPEYRFIKQGEEEFQAGFTFTGTGEHVVSFEYRSTITSALRSFFFRSEGLANDVDIHIFLEEYETWEDFAFSFTAPGTPVTFYLVPDPAENPNTGDVIFLRKILIEEGGDQNEYFNGWSPAAHWEGTPGRSKSVYQPQWLASPEFEFIKAILAGEDYEDGFVDIYLGQAIPFYPVIGDLWINGDTLSRFDGMGWEVIADPGDTILAVTIEGVAKLAAADRARVFVQDYAPTGLTEADAGSMWVNPAEGNKTYIWDGTDWVVDARFSEVATDLSNLQQQVAGLEGMADGMSVVYYQSPDPRNGQTWGLEHKGDIWIDITGGQKVYKVWSGEAWETITDPVALESLSRVNRKTTTYFSSEEPVAPAEGFTQGDLWIDSDTNQLYRWGPNPTTPGWRPVTYLDPRMQDALNDIGHMQSNLADIEGKVDGKSVIYYQPDAPTGLTSANSGDIWIDSDADPKTYKSWSGTEWVDVTDAVAQEALSKVENKITTYYSDEPPTGDLSVGDLWFETDDNQMHRYVGGTNPWVNITFIDSRVDSLAIQMIIDYEVEYAVNSSETVAPTTGWSADQPIRTAGQFIWYRTKITYGDASTTTSSAALLTGNAGEQGSDGVGITSVTPYYYRSSSATAPGKPTVLTPPSPWTTTEPDYVAGTYLYRTERIVYTNDSFAYTNVSKVATYAAISAQATAIAGLQSQYEELGIKVDGKAEIYYQTSAPTGLTTDNAGDIWVDSDADPKTYKVWNGSEWSDVTDTTAIEALSKVQSKVTTYYSDTPPTAPAEGFTNGDLWIDTDAGNQINRWQGSWVPIVFGIDALDVNARQLGGTVVWHDEDQPANPIVGDIWVETDNNNHMYRWDGETWVDITDPQIVEAVNAASTAQAIADGKVRLWAQPSAPTGLTEDDIGDMWIDTDDNNKLYVWGLGSGVWKWIDRSDSRITTMASNIVNLQNDYSSLSTQLDGKAVVYYQSTNPAVTGWGADQKGDIWIDTSSNPPLYKVWTGTGTPTTGWKTITDPVAQQALSEVTTKITTYYAGGTTAPSGTGFPPPGGYASGDLWIRSTDNRLFRYNGSAWVELKDKALDDLQDAVDEAQAAATTALASANGKNSRITSTSPATGTTNPNTGLPNVKGDTWWQWDSTNARNVIGAWTWDGSEWRTELINSEVIANLDVNKLVVMGSARMAQVVVDKIIGDAGHFGALTAERLVVAPESNLVRNGFGEFGLRRGFLDDSRVNFETADAPEGVTGYISYNGGLQLQGQDYREAFPVEPGEEFLVELWLRADKPDSRMYVEVRDQTGAHGGRHYPVAGYPSAVNGTWSQYIVNNWVVPTSWTKYTSRMVANAGATTLRVSGVYFNHSGGVEKTAKQDIALRIRRRTGSVRIEDGAVTASKLEAELVLSSKIIAGDAAGKAVELDDSDLTAWITTESGARKTYPMITLGTSGENALAITDGDTPDAIASMSSDGSVNGVMGNFQDDLIVNGQLLMGAWADRYGSAAGDRDSLFWHKPWGPWGDMMDVYDLFGSASWGHGVNQLLAWNTWRFLGGRQYRLHWNPSLVVSNTTNISNALYRIYRNTNGTAPVTTDWTWLVRRQEFGIDSRFMGTELSTIVSVASDTTVAMAPAILASGVTLALEPSLGNGNSGGNLFWVEDIGPVMERSGQGYGSSQPAIKKYTYYFYASDPIPQYQTVSGTLVNATNNSNTYTWNGVRQTKKAVQGRAGNSTYPYHSWLKFGGTTSVSGSASTGVSLASVLSGATKIATKLRLTGANPNDGSLPAKIGWGTGSTGHPSIQTTASSVGGGGTVTHVMPSAFNSYIVGKGSNLHISIGGAATTAWGDSGTFYGTDGTSSQRARLQVDVWK